MRESLDFFRSSNYFRKRSRNDEVDIRWLIKLANGCRPKCKYPTYCQFSLFMSNNFYINCTINFIYLCLLLLFLKNYLIHQIFFVFVSLNQNKERYYTDKIIILSLIGRQFKKPQEQQEEKKIFRLLTLILFFLLMLKINFHLVINGYFC